MPEPRDVVVRCAACAAVAARVQLLPPGGRPAGFGSWNRDLQEVFVQHRRDERWRFVYEGVEGGNGLGDDVDDAYAGRISEAFTEPLSYERVHTAGLYDDAGFCGECAAPYCFDHWNSAGRPDGTCPHGHWKSLDPHWSPV